jgi:hypothetical protein
MFSVAGIFVSYRKAREERAKSRCDGEVVHAAGEQVHLSGHVCACEGVQSLGAGVE